MRCVFDTMVIVAAMRSRRGGSNALLRAAVDGRCVMLASVPLFLEYEAVVTRPEHLLACGINRRDAIALLDYLAGQIVPVRISYLWRPSLSDPADEMVLETAINGNADCIVTSNARHFGPAARHGIDVVLPGTVLRRMG